MPIYLITYLKWTSSLKDTIYQNSHMKKLIIWIGLYLLKNLKQQLLTFRNRKHENQMVSLVNPTQHLFIQFSTLFPEVETGGTLPDPFYEASIPLTPKPEKDITDLCQRVGSLRRTRRPQSRESIGDGSPWRPNTSILHSFPRISGMDFL